MELLRTGEELRDKTAVIVRQGGMGDLVMALVTTGMLVGGGYLLWTRAGEIPGFFWIVVGPIALLSGFFMTVVAAAALGSFRNSFRASNWLAIVARSGVYLNLRSYRNGHFAERDLTVLRLGYPEITSLRRVCESRERQHGRRKEVRAVEYIEIGLEGVDTAPLSGAVERERTRKAATKKVIGIESSAKHHHLPVFVPGPGVVYVEHVRTLFRALESYVGSEERREDDLGARLSELSAEERIRALTLRGDRIEARSLVQSEFALDEKAAKAWMNEERAA